MRQVRIMALLGGLACWNEKETPSLSLTEQQDQRVVTVIEGCESWNGEHKEWCALQSMGSHDLSGSLVEKVCELMETEDVADLCWEMAVRQGNAPGEESLCEHIKSDFLRDSCHLTAVAREIPQGYDPADEIPLSALLQLCDRTGALRPACAELLVSARQDAWASSREDRHEHMTHEVRQMVMSWYPPLGEDRSFGMAIGMAVAQLNLDLGENGACEVFAYGPPKLACIHNAHKDR
jgi:hypothetical protein